MSSRPSPRVLLLITHFDAGGAQETVLSLARGLPAYGFEVAVGGRPGHEDELVRTLGARVIDVPHLTRPVAPATDARAYLEIRRLLRAGRFDVVHTHSSKAGVLGRLAARFARVRAVVHTSHGLPVNPDMGAVNRRMLLTAERMAARMSDRIVAVSHATAAELLDLRLARPSQLAVIPSGVDIARPLPERSRARDALGIPAGAPVAGWVGRFFPQKRPEQVVAAARRIVRALPDALVVLAGDGPLLDRARSSISDEPRIRFLGHRADVETVYAAIDVMLLASAWEGLPRTVLEAMAAGVPVVATDVSGIKEVVADGRNGYLVEVGHWTSVADKVVTILADPVLRTRLGREARAAVTQAYSCEHMVRATAQLYYDLLSPASRD